MEKPTSLKRVQNLPAGFMLSNDHRTTGVILMKIDYGLSKIGVRKFISRLSSCRKGAILAHFCSQTSW